MKKHYRTPFIGLFVDPVSYLALVSRLRWYLDQPLRFVERSRHEHVNRFRQEQGHPYPIGCLGDDVEIQFLHYASASEATESGAAGLRG